MKLYRNQFDASKILIALILFCSFLGSNYRASCSREQSRINIGEILNNIDLQSISITSIDSALPRLTDDEMIRRLRAGDIEFTRGIKVENADTLKKCFIIGASFTLSEWELAFFLKGKKSLRDLKSATELNLTIVNHLLESIGATKSVLLKIDSLKSHFKASEDSIVGSEDMGNIFTLTRKDIRSFLKLHNPRYEKSFQFGRWLVFEALLSKLYIESSNNKRQREYLMAAMNRYYAPVNIDDFLLIADNMCWPHDGVVRETLKEKVSEFKTFFAVQNAEEVKKVEDLVYSIFDICEISFPY